MRPSLLGIVNTDWPALFAAIGLPMILVIAALYPHGFPVAGSKWALLLEVGLPLAAACAGLLAWRCLRVLELFRSGIPSAGHITQIQLVKDRGRIDFSYELNGATHRCWQPVHRTRRVLALETGQDVQVLVHPRKAGVAIIKDIFHKSGEA
ncbi:hypothetical protein OOZ63_14205 [Paucibacter sp. PLA-PC-4]|uniref:hypothetical protein n=1 Tax=Paucibacter sp. PLA-PC-4 TaxID=2993655 RepID=UPI0022495CC9|nr:hypothetical protein [Paucibacter sp. PLA-PC-4]MCX2862980.1 hypothetical protein [Paucibacter sp. PLA-PC-4]